MLKLNVTIVLAMVLQTQAPADEDILSIHYEFGVGARNVFDSKSGRFVKDLVCDQEVAETALTLTSSDHRKILDAANSVAFFDLTEHVVPRCIVEPAASYRLSIQTTRREHMVEWQDSCVGDDGARAAQVARAVEEAIRATEAYKALPTSQCVYL